MFDWIRAQLRRRHARRHLKRPAETTPFGFDFFGPRSMQTGVFEPSETILLRKFLSQADLFVNVGANIGYYVCMARQLGVRTVAIEPVPINLETLNRNIKINNWDADIVVHPVACGATAATAVIFGEGTSASFVSGWARNPNALKHTVPVERLDDLLAKEKVTSKSVFLVDVEGFELEVLRGAEKVLASPCRPVWILESGLTDHRPGGKMNVAFLDVLQIVLRNDYRVFSALDTSFEVTLDFVEKNIEQGVDELGTHNFLLVPNTFDLSLIDE
jgi:FkbM family methyltransferase